MVLAKAFRRIVLTVATIAQIIVGALIIRYVVQLQDIDVDQEDRAVEVSCALDHHSNETGEDDESLCILGFAGVALTFALMLALSVVLVCPLSPSVTAVGTTVLTCCTSHPSSAWNMFTHSCSAYLPTQVQASLPQNSFLCLGLLRRTCRALWTAVHIHRMVTAVHIRILMRELHRRLQVSQCYVTSRTCSVLVFVHSTTQVAVSTGRGFFVHACELMAVFRHFMKQGKENPT